MASIQWRDNLVLPRDPDEVAEYRIDFEPLLEGVDNVASIVVTPVDITVDAESFSGDVVTVILSGASADTTSKISVKITTDGAPPRVFERSFKLRNFER